MIFYKDELFKKANIGLHEFNEKKNNLLFIRREGGCGDILLHRMLFEDVKRLLPESRITFACPKIYHSAVSSHPYIDDIVDSDTVNVNDFLYYYDTTHCENTVKPDLVTHKVDVWANHCGIKLANHNMHLNTCLPNSSNQKPTVLFAPFSAMSSKSLTVKQANEVIKLLKDYNFIIVHNKHIDGLDAPCIHNLNISELIKLTNNVDCVITVDTLHLHIAGGLNKKTVGIFGWTSGKLFCKYYKNTTVVQFGEPSVMQSSEQIKLFDAQTVVDAFNHQRNC